MDEIKRLTVTQILDIVLHPRDQEGKMVPSRIPGDGDSESPDPRPLDWRRELYALGITDPNQADKLVTLGRDY